MRKACCDERLRSTDQWSFSAVKECLTFASSLNQDFSRLRMLLNSHRRLAFALALSCAAHLLAGMIVSSRIAVTRLDSLPRPTGISVSLPFQLPVEDQRNRSQPYENLATEFPAQAEVQANPDKLAKEPLAERVSLSPPAKQQPEWINPEFGLNSYLPVNALERKPEVTLDVPIDPADLRDFKEGGTARLVLWINSAGGVDKVSEETSTLRDEALERLETHFKAARFSPGTLGGHPVATMLHIEVRVLPIKETPNQSKSTILKD